MKSYQLFKDLDAATEAALRASVDRFGVLVPVAKDQHGNTIDGYQRERIAQELGIKYPVNVIEVSDEQEAREIARTLNEDRRAMPREQRLEVEKALREEGHSLRAIAGVVGVSEKTVHQDLSGVTLVSPASQVNEIKGQVIKGLDGKSYPSRKTPKLPPAEALRQAREVKSDLRAQRDLDREQQRQEVLSKSHPLGGKNWRVFCADIKDIADEGEEEEYVDRILLPEKPSIIITDPPYGFEYLRLYNELDRMAYEVLPEGGSLLAMCGQANINLLLRWDESLWTRREKEMHGSDPDYIPGPSMFYHWMLACFTPGASVQVFGRDVKSNWKPVIWWTKGSYAGEDIQDDIQGRETWTLTR